MPHAPTAFAGIGSRQTPRNVLDLMSAIAFRLAEKGHTLRSGGASGADLAFEHGCNMANGQKEIYIPWDGFNTRRSSERGVYSLPATARLADAMQLASEIHPNWSACSQGARQLHARNCYQILGVNLDAPVSDVVCWTPNGSGSGGTGQAIRLAKMMNIPVWDLGNPEVFLKFQRMFDLPNTSTQ